MLMLMEVLMGPGCGVGKAVHASAQRVRLVQLAAAMPRRIADGHPYVLRSRTANLYHPSLPWAG